ncbi:VOC family protein [Paraburkholderia terrae]|uniref:VOC family protein n=1 Tax=Paraburkholderia terrae TaxID=311230 RepID=A0A2I8F2C7_9BURK|nr:VOC family protein [Paraburkholderia terrae]AUT65812.1 VOC family protein [Paraburkholderia terrae]
MPVLKTMHRLYVARDQLESSVAFYEAIQDVRCERRLSFEPMGIEVAVVGSFILLAGSDEALAPVRHIQAALIVDALDVYAQRLRELGATFLSETHENAVGRNMTVRHPDGLVVEYFEPVKSAAA